MINCKAPKIIGFAGYSGAGKTTLIEKLTQRFIIAGFNVALIKHTHHKKISNAKNSDTKRHHIAGAKQVILASDNFYTINDVFIELSKPKTLSEYINLSQAHDLIFIEGFKHEPINKIEILNKKIFNKPLYLTDKNIIAIVSDEKLNTNEKPNFLRDDIEAMFQFILKLPTQDKNNANR